MEGICLVIGRCEMQESVSISRCCKRGVGLHATSPQRLWWYNQAVQQQQPCKEDRRASDMVWNTRLDVYRMLKLTQIILASSPALSVSKKKMRCIWFGFLRMEPNSYARVCFPTPTRSGTLLPVHSTSASSLLFILQVSHMEQQYGRSPSYMVNWIPLSWKELPPLTHKLARLNGQYAYPCLSLGIFNFPIAFYEFQFILFS